MSGIIPADLRPAFPVPVPDAQVREKLLELLFIFFAALLCLLLVKEGDRSSRTVPLKHQIATA